MKALRTAADVDALTDKLEDLAESWALPMHERDGRVDWDWFLTRVEESLDVDLGDELDSPVIRRVRAITRQVIRSAT